MSLPTDEAALRERFATSVVPMPDRAGDEVLAAAHATLADRRRRRGRWTSVAAVLSVLLVAGGSALALHGAPRQVSAGSGGSISSSPVITPFTQWPARGSKLGDASVVAQTRSLLEETAGGSPVTVLYSGSLYGGDGTAVLARWRQDDGWGVGLLTTPTTGLASTAGSSPQDLLLRGTTTIGVDDAPAYVGFLVHQKAVDGTPETLAFALTAPGVGGGTFRVAMTEAPESDRPSGSQTETDVAATVVTGSAAPWNTSLATAAGAWGVLGTDTSTPALPSVDIVDSARSDGLVEVASTHPMRPGDVIASAAGLYGVVTATTQAGHAMVRTDPVAAASKLRVYSWISDHPGTITSASGSDVIGQFTPQDSQATDVNHVVAAPKDNPAIVIGVGQTIPGSMLLEPLGRADAFPLYLVSTTAR